MYTNKTFFLKGTKTCLFSNLYEVIHYILMCVEKKALEEEEKKIMCAEKKKMNLSQQQVAAD
jgi:hypothetical protein